MVVLDGGRGNDYIHSGGSQKEGTERIDKSRTSEGDMENSSEVR